MREIASALGARGDLGAYVLPFNSFARFERAATRLPAPAARRLANQLRRRSTPDGVDERRVKLRASVSEMFVVGTRRAAVPRQIRNEVVLFRNAVFDNAVSRLVDQGDDAVIAPYGAARRTLGAARARGVTSFLNYPIAHHEATRRILLEEVERVPEFAGTLQLHDLPERHLARLDDEVETADCVFVLSSYQRSTFVEAGVDPGKLRLTPLGVDLRTFTPGPRTDDGVFRVAFAGQITQRKGISYLLDAFQRAALPRSELVLIGNFHRDAAPILRRPGVRHVPHLPRWELPEQYRRADVFVLPSLVEGFGLTALEAMACGVPVIVSGHTFGRDVVNDGVEGFVVPIRDADAIADRLTTLAEDRSLRDRMAAAARRRAEDFPWDIYRERVTRTIDEVLDGRSGAS